MVEPPTVEMPPSLLGITIRRSMVLGRLYLILGIGLSLFYGIVFAAAGGEAFQTVFPLLLPIMAVVGGMGGVMVFTNDRMKGVFEYLLAYGVTPRQLFTDVLVSGVVQVTIVMGVAVAGGLVVYVATGHGLTLSLATAIAVYSFPMGYVAVAFASLLGMIWTSLSAPREGMSSPTGLVPIIGVMPPVAVLALALARPAWAVGIVLGAVAVLAVLVVSLLNLVGRLMRLERLLSPA